LPSTAFFHNGSANDARVFFTTKLTKYTKYTKMNRCNPSQAAALRRHGV